MDDQRGKPYNTSIRDHDQTIPQYQILDIDLLNINWDISDYKIRMKMIRFDENETNIKQDSDLQSIGLLWINSKWRDWEWMEWDWQ